jgi:hypothetical protein
MTESDYANAWIIYLSGTVLLLLVWWRITRRWNHWIKLPCLLLVTAFLLIPYNIESGSLNMGPAWLIAFYELLFVPEAGFVRAGPTLLVAMAGAFLIYPIIVALWRLLRYFLKSSTKSEPDTDQAQVQPE